MPYVHTPFMTQEMTARAEWLIAIFSLRVDATIKMSEQVMIPIPPLPQIARLINLHLPARGWFQPY